MSAPSLPVPAILAVTFLLLAGMVATDATGTFRPPPDVTDYYASVADSIEAIPYQYGPWIGRDIPATPAAVEMLRPNKLFQRRYLNAETGVSFELLVVHCGDVRDMIGHFPPVCYPAHGWDLERKFPLGVDIGQSSADAIAYEFSIERDFASDTMLVLSLFAVPSSEGLVLGGAYGPIEYAGRYRDRARLGAAQIQVITAAGLSDEQRASIHASALSLITETVAAVGEGPL